MEVVINTQSYPHPYHNPSSLLLSLEAFSNAFHELRGGSSDVKMTYMDQNAFGPNPVQRDVVHHFAEMLSGDILHAAVGKQKTQFTKDDDQICNTAQSEMSRWTVSVPVKLANRLAAEIYCSALEDLAKHGCSSGGTSDDLANLEMNTEIHSESASYHYHHSMQHCDQEGPAMEIDHIYHRRSITNPTTLDDMSQQVSLDYPDAPPSTPLLPEMMKSRASFTRKLKGGLAMEFLPSTPPPTPKDQQSHLEDKITDSTEYKTEFMVRLMRSLSLACSLPGEEGNGTENKIRFQSEISDYAAQLSADIIQCITAAQADSNRNIETPIRDMQVLADQLAEKIIMTAIVKSKKEQRTSQEIPSHFENTSKSMNDSLSSDSIINLPSVEALGDMAGKLVTKTLIQAFSELGCVSLQHATSKQISDPASDLIAWEQGKDQSLNTDWHITKTNGCSTGKSESKYMTLDSRTEAVEHFFAENIVHEVLKCSMREASNYHLRCKQSSVHSDSLRASAASQTVIRAFISETLCRDTQELQCVLLWVAASQMGTSVLQIDQTDKHIQQQV
ncbi:hypothetical protein C0J50_14634 [Silurus asotus]|uniref:Uncharacterized protein n=1 Tax=Silurus asotus TaxID=30991 RepID=A0AAD5AZG2_SILAS|nr:hypothetical protein C0J50_14634 [Silurus asotus]